MLGIIIVFASVFLCAFYLDYKGYSPHETLRIVYCTSVVIVGVAGVVGLFFTRPLTWLHVVKGLFFTFVPVINTAVLFVGFSFITANLLVDLVTSGWSSLAKKLDKPIWKEK